MMMHAPVYSKFCHSFLSQKEECAIFGLGREGKDMMNILVKKKQFNFGACFLKFHIYVRLTLTSFIFYYDFRNFI